VRLVLASRNAHKLRELGELMAPHELEPLPEEIELPPETATTFAGNALIKARAAAVATGRPSLADDSGIEAAALGGAPGVFSARYASDAATDDENLAKLLHEVPPDGDKRVAYVCVLAVVDPEGDELVAEGHCEGELTHDPRGDGGFGYDPAFVPADRDDGRTMAELDPSEKDEISHRGRAARALLEQLRSAEAGAPRLRGLFELSGRRRSRR
jgi:XTP/dITP diphosphohydrolase